MPPPSRSLPIIQKLIVVYKLWHGYCAHFDKFSRHSLALKIDLRFIETIENLFIASYQTREHKLLYLNKASSAFDVLKFLLRVAWEIKILADKKYIALSVDLNEIGRMLGGWRKNNNPI